MCKSSLNNGTHSEAAEFVYTQTLELNGNLVNGYIGSQTQMGIIFGSDVNKTVIGNALTSLGYSTVFGSTNKFQTTTRSFDRRSVAYIANNTTAVWAWISDKIYVLPLFTLP